MSALSHDLRRPLIALMGLAEYLTLSKPPLWGEQREVAASLQEQARRMTGMVDNLLDMGRLQAGPVRLDKQWQPLLAHLIANAGKVLTHRQLLRDVWGPARVENNPSLRVFMAHLRQKIERDPSRPAHLLTEIGVGYRLVL